MNCLVATFILFSTWGRRDRAITSDGGEEAGANVLIHLGLSLQTAEAKNDSGRDNREWTYSMKPAGTRADGRFSRGCKGWHYPRTCLDFFL